MGENLQGYELNLMMISWTDSSYYKVQLPVLNYIPSHEDVWGSGGLTPSITNQGTRWG